MDRRDTGILSADEIRRTIDKLVEDGRPPAEIVSWALTWTAALAISVVGRDAYLHWLAEHARETETLDANYQNAKRSRARKRAGA